MCRFVYITGSESKASVAMVLDRAQRPYLRKCREDLSYGSADCRRVIRRIPDRRDLFMPACHGETLQVYPGEAMYHIRLRNGPGTTSIANTHPFVKGAWVMMHNGVIPGYSDETKTDSETLMDAILETLRVGRGAGRLCLAVAVSTVMMSPALKGALVNLAMMNRVTGEAIVYRHNDRKRFPAIWAHSFGFTNFKIPGGSQLRKYEARYRLEHGRIWQSLNLR